MIILNKRNGLQHIVQTGNLKCGYHTNRSLIKQSLSESNPTIHPIWKFKFTSARIRRNDDFDKIPQRTSRS